VHATDRGRKRQRAVADARSSPCAHADGVVDISHEIAQAANRSLTSMHTQRRALLLWMPIPLYKTAEPLLHPLSSLSVGTAPWLATTTALVSAPVRKRQQALAVMAGAHHPSRIDRISLSRGKGCICFTPPRHYSRNPSRSAAPLQPPSPLPLRRRHHHIATASFARRCSSASSVVSPVQPFQQLTGLADLCGNVFLSSAPSFPSASFCDRKHTM
jgi:hypothetical protein